MQVDQRTRAPMFRAMAMMSIACSFAVTSADDFVAIDGTMVGGEVSIDEAVTTPSPTAYYGFPQELWDPAHDCPNAGHASLTLGLFRTPQYSYFLL